MASDAAITTSAPGSLMLLGEHAVLHGHRALVAAINLRMSVQLIPLEDDSVEIVSALGNYHAQLERLVDHASFKFVLQAIRTHRSVLNKGFRLKIDSEFPPDIGFGSSAAVTVATHAALMHWTGREPPGREDVFHHALETVRTVQGRGSGADVAASVYGGMVGYSTEPTFDHIDLSIPITAVYCGYKTPTPEVIGKVEQKRLADPERFVRIYEEIDTSVGDAIERLRGHDFPGFGRILNRNHELMDAMGVGTPELDEIVAALQVEPDVFGAKISGSGLGDCAIGVGYAKLAQLDYPVRHLEITPLGCEWNG